MYGIVTDPGSYLPAKLMEEERIIQVPFTINLGQEESIEDRGHLDLEYLIQKIDRFIKEKAGRVTTAAPPPSKWVEAYEQLWSGGVRQAVAITLSQKLSRSWQSATQAAREFVESYPQAEIEVVDSQGGTMVEGFVVMDAVEAKKQGMSLHEAVEWIRARVPRRKLFAAFEETKYLLASGRIPKFKHYLATAFNIRPIITLQEGAAIIKERVRGRMDRAFDRIVAELEKICKEKGFSRLAVVEGLAPDLREQLTDMLVQRLGISRERIIQASVGSAILVHTGKRAAGVVVET